VIIKSIGWLAVLALLIASVFLLYYKSLDPCEWMTQEMSRNAGLPMEGLGRLVAPAMSTGECAQNWLDALLDSPDDIRTN
jgi:hypothetical protein